MLPRTLRTVNDMAPGEPRSRDAVEDLRTGDGGAFRRVDAGRAVGVWIRARRLQGPADLARAWGLTRTLRSGDRVPLGRYGRQPDRRGVVVEQPHLGRDRLPGLALD